MTRYVQLPRLTDVRFGPLPAGANERRLYRDGPGPGSFEAPSVCLVTPSGHPALDPLDPSLLLAPVHGPDNPYVAPFGARVVEYEVLEGVGVVVFRVPQVGHRGERHRIFAELAEGAR